MYGRDLQAILRLINEERDMQDARWGGASHDDANTPADWVSIFTRQLGLAAPENPSVPVDPAHWRRQMVRLAAVAFAALEADFRRRPPEKLAAPGPHGGLSG